MSSKAPPVHRPIQLHQDEVGKLVGVAARHVFGPNIPLLVRDCLIRRMLLESWRVSQTLGAAGDEPHDDRLRHLPVGQLIGILSTVNHQILPLDGHAVHSTLAAAPIVELVQKAVQFPAGFQGIKYQLEEGLADDHVALDGAFVVRGDHRAALGHRDPKAGDVHDELPLVADTRLHSGLKEPALRSAFRLPPRVLHGVLGLVLRVD
mmetsp:Transcript_12643/g.30046  ORF Transcript_12643/g.30046 Transcript_12643/m.30046 type:complete len:206 (+) Transcript_12643:529-1146(+)